FHALCIPFYQDHLTIKTDFLEISKMLQPRLVILSDIPEMIDFLNALPDYDVQMYFHPKMKTDKAICITALEASIELFAHFKAWDDVLAFQTALSALPIKLSLKNGQVYWPIRTAVTGKQFTPGGAMEIPYILGQAETIFRCQVGLAKLKALTD
ncbi:MAG: glutamate--tRNA ligase, partial [Erysipelotrichaceae bacterium]